LLLAPLVAPDEGRAGHLVFCIKDDQPVHLTGEPHTAHVLPGHTCLREHSTDRGHRRFPPILRPLLGPEPTPHSHVLMLRRESGRRRSAIVHQECARTSGADIDPKPHRIVWCHKSAPSLIPSSSRRFSGIATS